MNEQDNTKELISSLEDESITSNISKISFIFVAFLVIAGGYTTQIFSCSLQRFLSTNMYGKHLIGIGLIFVFIMLEGGWDFDRERLKKAPVDWSNGNCIDSMVYAFGIYLILLLSSKMRLGWNTLLFVFLFILYFVNTQRLYYFNRNIINKEDNENIVNIEKKVLYILPIILLIGVLDYYNYKVNQLGKEFNLYLFFLGSPACKSMQ